MGGEDSGVSETTTDVMLEVAYFTPERIARTGQALGLTSDARSRFERGVDPAFLDDGLAILTGLILDICGGEPRRRSSVGRTAGRADARSRSTSRRTKALGGIDVPEERQREILESLGFEVNGNQVTVPTWRRDVEGPADLVEEVARINGYDQVPSTPLDRAPGVAKPTATRSQLIERRVRRTAAARGLDEAVTWSFISEEEADAFGGGDWRLANPISEEMKVMRPSLLPGLIAAARRNLDRGASSVRLFEIGRRYLGDAEHPTLGLILAGERRRARLAIGQGAAVRRLRRQGRGHCAARCRRRAGRQPAGFPRRRPDLASRAARRRSGSGRRPSSRPSASFTRACSKSLDAPAGSGRRRDLPRRDPGTALERPRARRICAAGAPGGHARLRLHRAGRARRRTICSARSAAPTRARSPASACSTGSKPPTGSQLAFEVTLQPVEKSFTDEQIGEISKRDRRRRRKARRAPQVLVRAH